MTDEQRTKLATAAERYAVVMCLGQALMLKHQHHADVQRLMGMFIKGAELAMLLQLQEVTPVITEEALAADASSEFAVPLWSMLEELAAEQAAAGDTEVAEEMRTRVRRLRRLVEKAGRRVLLTDAAE